MESSTMGMLSQIESTPLIVINYLLRQFCLCDVRQHGDLVRRGIHFLRANALASRYDLQLAIQAFWAGKPDVFDATGILVLVLSSPMWTEDEGRSFLFGELQRLLPRVSFLACISPLVTDTTGVILCDVVMEALEHHLPQGMMAALRSTLVDNDNDNEDQGTSEVDVTYVSDPAPSVWRSRSVDETPFEQHPSLDECEAHDIDYSRETNPMPAFETLDDLVKSVQSSVERTLAETKSFPRALQAGVDYIRAKKVTSLPP
jgi:hypothetical protein